MSSLLITTISFSLYKFSQSNFRNRHLLLSRTFKFFLRASLHPFFEPLQNLLSCLPRRTDQKDETMSPCILLWQRSDFVQCTTWCLRRFSLFLFAPLRVCPRLCSYFRMRAEHLHPLLFAQGRACTVRHSLQCIHIWKWSFVQHERSVGVAGTTRMHHLEEGKASAFIYLR